MVQRQLFAGFGQLWFGNCWSQMGWGACGEVGLLTHQLLCQNVVAWFFASESAPNSHIFINDLKALCKVFFQISFISVFYTKMHCVCSWGLINMFIAFSFRAKKIFFFFLKYFETLETPSMVLNDTLLNFLAHYGHPLYFIVSKIGGKQPHCITTHSRTRTSKQICWRNNWPTMALLAGLNMGSSCAIKIVTKTWDQSSWLSQLTICIFFISDKVNCSICYRGLRAKNDIRGTNMSLGWSKTKQNIGPVIG